MYFLVLLDLNIMEKCIMQKLGMPYVMMRNNLIDCLIQHQR